MSSDVLLRGRRGDLLHKHADLHKRVQWLETHVMGRPPIVKPQAWTTLGWVTSRYNLGFTVTSFGGTTSESVGSGPGLWGVESDTIPQSADNGGQYDPFIYNLDSAANWGPAIFAMADGFNTAGADTEFVNANHYKWGTGNLVWKPFTSALTPEFPGEVTSPDSLFPLPWQHPTPLGNYWAAPAETVSGLVNATLNGVYVAGKRLCMLIAARDPGTTIPEPSITINEYRFRLLQWMLRYGKVHWRGTLNFAPTNPASEVATSVAQADGMPVPPDREHGQILWTNLGPKYALFQPVGDHWELSFPGHTVGVDITSASMDGMHYPAAAWYT